MATDEVKKLLSDAELLALVNRTTGRNCASLDEYTKSELLRVYVAMLAAQSGATIIQCGKGKQQRKDR